MLYAGVSCDFFCAGVHCTCCLHLVVSYTSLLHDYSLFYACLLYTCVVYSVVSFIRTRPGWSSGDAVCSISLQYISHIANVTSARHEIKSNI